MLRRAASNAYSWWWASHIRTSQSKWLENIIRAFGDEIQEGEGKGGKYTKNEVGARTVVCIAGSGSKDAWPVQWISTMKRCRLHQMDDRVKAMLKIIEEDADSFSKKAELYFKKRPELIKLVEETYRAYRALAERYDHISGELHKANHTIATAFPDQVQLDVQEDDEDHLPKAITSIDFSRLSRLALDTSRDSLKSEKKGNPSFNRSRPPPKIDRRRVPEEIDRIQKEILVLQTEKEFIRSSYENAIARYQEIENQIASMQDELCFLQDEFGDSVVIEDDEARTLMATAALKSCEDTLFSLQENHRRSVEFTRIGSKKIMMAKEKLKSFKQGPEENRIISEKSEGTNLNAVVVEDVPVSKPDQISVQIGPNMSLVELAEKINELVDKVITLELTTSSQNAQIENLRSETDELHKHVESLEEEKLNLIQDSGSLSDRLKQTEEELQKIQDINKVSCDAKDDASTILNNAPLGGASNLEKLQHLKHEAKVAFYSQEEEIADPNTEPLVSQNKEIEEMHVSIAGVTNELYETEDSTSRGQLLLQDDSLNLMQSLSKGADDKEKILLTEHTSILCNYEQIKKRLFEVDLKNQAYVLETTTQLVELKKAYDLKDEELRSMRRLFSKQQRNPNENEPEVSNKEESLSSLRGPRMSESASFQVTVKKDSEHEAIDTLQAASQVEEKFRSGIDALLDENLNFWLRFCSSFQQIQKFQFEFDDLQAAFKRLDERNFEEDGGSASSDSEPLDKQLRELKSELQVWLEQNDLLKGESQTRFKSLCSIQEEISEALASSLEFGTYQLSPYQAAKFQGEVSNMQHENSKVANELQLGVDHVRGLRTEVEKILSEFQKKFELSGSQVSRQHNRPLKYFSSKTHIPLRNFLFGIKPKKKPSIFKCMNPLYQKQYSDLSSGFPS